jgi:hypothetical protein
MQVKFLGIYLAGFVYIIGFVIRVHFVPSLEGWLYISLLLHRAFLRFTNY